MLKSLPTIVEPDDRFRHLSFHDQVAGHIRPLCVGDLRNDVSLIELSRRSPQKFAINSMWRETLIYTRGLFTT
jgi:hypothetical protein